MASIPIVTMLEEAPDARERAAIRPGDFVKVSRCRERFWIRVVAATGTHLIGEIDTETVEPENAHLTVGKVVRFEARHVYSIVQPPEGITR